MYRPPDKGKPAPNAIGTGSEHINSEAAIDEVKDNGLARPIQPLDYPFAYSQSFGVIGFAAYIAHGPGREERRPGLFNARSDAHRAAGELNRLLQAERAAA